MLARRASSQHTLHDSGSSGSSSGERAKFCMNCEWRDSINELNEPGRRDPDYVGDGEIERQSRRDCSN